MDEATNVNPQDSESLSRPAAGQAAEGGEGRLEESLGQGPGNGRSIGGYPGSEAGAEGEAPPAEAPPAEAPPRPVESQETTRLKAGLSQMVVTMKNMALYPESNRTNYESVTFLHLWLSEYLSHHSPLVLEVAKDHLIGPNGDVVYQERPGDKILATPMFRDGIQSIIFESGLTEAELRAFLNILLRFRNPSEADEDDLVGRLWEASFSYIRYTIATEYEQFGPEFETSALKVAKSASEYRDADAPMNDDVLAPQRSENLAPVAKPIASLFALAESHDLLNAAKPPGEKKPKGSGLKSRSSQPSAGAGFEDGEGGEEGDDEGDEDGFSPFAGSYDWGVGLAGGGGQAKGHGPSGGKRQSAADAQADLGSGAGKSGTGKSGPGKGPGPGGPGSGDPAKSGSSKKGKSSDSWDGEAYEDDDDDLDFDPGIVAEAFKDVEDYDATRPKKESLAPAMEMTLEALKNRPQAHGPELAERLRHWNLSPKEIRQIGALLNWDESRDPSFDAMEIISVLLSSPVLQAEQLTLVTNFISNEVRTSLRKLKLKYFNNFIIELGKRAQMGGRFDGTVAEQIIKKLSSADLLIHLVEPVPTVEKLDQGYEDLRWLLYQLPASGVVTLTNILGKAVANRKLWTLLLEVISYEVIRSRGRSIDILTQLNERALAKLVEIARTSISSLPPQLIQTLTRHKAGAVREATARALMEYDPENFHTYCAHLVLDPDPKVARMVRPMLATKRNPAVEWHLFTLLRDSYTRNRHGEDLHLLDNYRLFGCTASPKAVTFLEEVLLRKDFKTFISRTVDAHKLGAALALFMMPHIDAARDVLDRAGRSSFRNVRQAYLEAERLAQGPVQ
ncbi:MAG: hypothetical protein LBE49_02775 [Deltaproteobacteria bacterium]|nr:hypothetical protein [Deltaproteobacteria bacterium]